mmetsp:Transcript_91633/g.275121  ORF Transcript_91633/g.275121 Transcript_91633/m.275121 type:complete len:238 (+) Transcript_91633:393-1106(+)|eukprot:3012912-Prymnesium_polylepis.2
MEANLDARARQQRDTPREVGGRVTHPIVERRVRRAELRVKVVERREARLARVALPRAEDLAAATSRAAHAQLCARRRGHQLARSGVAARAFTPTFGVMTGLAARRAAHATVRTAARAVLRGPARSPIQLPAISTGAPSISTERKPRRRRRRDVPHGAVGHLAQVPHPTSDGTAAFTARAAALAARRVIAQRPEPLDAPLAQGGRVDVPPVEGGLPRRARLLLLAQLRSGGRGRERGC